MRWGTVRTRDPAVARNVSGAAQSVDPRDQVGILTWPTLPSPHTVPLSSSPARKAAQASKLSQRVYLVLRGIWTTEASQSQTPAEAGKHRKYTADVERTEPKDRTPLPTC